MPLSEYANSKQCWVECNDSETNRWSDLQHGEQAMSDSAYSGTKNFLQGIPPYLDEIQMYQCTWASTQTPSSVEWSAMTARPTDSDLQHGEQAKSETAFSGTKNFCKGLPPTLIKIKCINAPERVRKPQAVTSGVQWQRDRKMEWPATWWAINVR
jgi:hypothetical protein